MQNLSHIIKNLKYLNRTIGAQELYANLNVDLKVTKSKQIPGDNILILATYPGDDIFACGGIIKKYTKNGKRISILYFCDGSMGNKSAIRDSSLVIKRKRESREAARILGVKENNLVFWGFKDHKLAPHATNIKALSNLLINIKPDVIFLPTLFEMNSDSHELNNIFTDVLNIYGSSLEYFAIWTYEFFTPLYPNKIIDISDQIDFKKKAMDCFTSQLQIKNYHKAILGLNSYRAQVNGINGFSEAYFSCNTNLYLKLHSLVNKK